MREKVTAEQLAGWMNAEFERRDVPEPVRLRAYFYLLQARGPDGCNWSDSYVFAGEPNGYLSDIVPVVREARQKFDLVR